MVRVKVDLTEEERLSEDVRKYKHLYDKLCSGSNERLMN